MTDSTAKASRRGRPIGILATGTIVYFLTLILVLYVLDRQLYMSKKSELIRPPNFYEIFPLPDDMQIQARKVLFPTSHSERVTANDALVQTMKSIVDGPTSMYKLELLDTSKTVVLVADSSSKIDQFNTWRNSLFLRNFSGQTTLMVKNPIAPMESGQLIGSYTSPTNFAPIEQLTGYFRWLALLLVSLWVAIYAFLYRHLLRPMQNVTRYLEHSRESPPRLILKASAHLENAYNQLAGRALLQLIEERLSSSARPDADGQAEDRGAAVSEALAIAADAFGVQKITAAEIAASSDNVAVTESFSPASQEIPVKDDELLAQAQMYVGHAKSPLLPEDGEFRAESDSPAFTYFAPLGNGSYLLLTGAMDEAIPRLRRRLDDLHRACVVFRRGFLAYKAYRQGIVRERSEANIVLSRNLGHDLTNIIATSKLDLMAVRRLLDAPAGGADGTRSQLLRQAIEGLLENTKFLQEIVNIYRSFSNVKRPQYERRDLRGLIEEFLAAFEPSVSARIQIRRELDTAMPAPIVEPRLLKLALFNVLTNAMDALRKSASAESAGGTVTVRTSFEAGTNTYQIQVEDNGPGIRDDQGRLLAPAELQSIFEYGYSTKAESSEGLGLSWVRTIMTEFHDGSVAAQNLAESGARFTLHLKSMERAEAKVG